MKSLIKFGMWILAFLLFWTGVEVLSNDRSLFPLSLVADALNLLDFGIHEMGHMVLGLIPVTLIGVLGGSLFQWTAPLVLVAYSLYRRRYAGIVLGLFWFGQSLIHSVPYIADARSQSLPLLSPFFYTDASFIHDWNYMLTACRLLWADQLIAGLFYICGAGLMLLAVAILALPLEVSGRWIGTLFNQRGAGERYPGGLI